MLRNGVVVGVAGAQEAPVSALVFCGDWHVAARAYRQQPTRHIYITAMLVYCAALCCAQHVGHGIGIGIAYALSEVSCNAQ